MSDTTTMKTPAPFLCAPCGFRSSYRTVERMSKRMEIYRDDIKLIIGYKEGGVLKCLHCYLGIKNGASPKGKNC